jgi:hypothetical protein
MRPKAEPGVAASGLARFGLGLPFGHPLRDTGLAPRFVSRLLFRRAHRMPLAGDLDIATPRGGIGFLQRHRRHLPAAEVRLEDLHVEVEHMWVEVATISGPLVVEAIESEFVAREIVDMRIFFLHFAHEFVHSHAQHALRHRIRRNACHRPERGSQRDRRHREDDRRVRPVAPDQPADLVQVGLVFRDCGHTELVTLRIHLVHRHRAPEHLAGGLVVPHLGNPQRDDEDVGLVEELAGIGANVLVVAERLRVVAEPQIGPGLAALPGPLELLGNRKRVGDAVAHLRNVGLAAFPLRQHVEAARCEVVADVLGETGAEGNDGCGLVDEGLRGHPTFDEIVGHASGRGQRLIGRVEIGVLTTVEAGAGAKRLAVLLDLNRGHLGCCSYAASSGARSGLKVGYFAPCQNCSLPAPPFSVSGTGPSST